MPEQIAAPPDSIPIAVLALMFAIGFIGVLAHWFKSAMNKQAPWNLFVYLFRDRPGASGSMFALYCGAFWGLYVMGTFDLVKWEYVQSAWQNGILFEPFRAAAMQSILAGFACDSLMNRSGPPKKDRRAEYKEAGK